MSKHRRSLLERLHEIEPITDYADSAFTGSMESKSVPPKIKRLPSASTVMPNGTRCHEYLAIDGGSDRLESQNSDFSRRLKHREGQLAERLLARDKVELPRAYVLYNWFGMLSTWVKFFRLVFMVLSWMSLVAFLITSPISWIIQGQINLETEFKLMLMLLIIPAVYLILRIIDDLELITWLDFDPKPNVIYRRDLGTVLLRRWFRKTPNIVPFSEIQGINRQVPYSNSLPGYLFMIRHKHSKIIHNGIGKSSVMLDGFWMNIIEWEILQHYMDVTRPLPDIPRFEPYRHLDPVTKAWDEEHQRPRWLWRDMDTEEYGKLARASAEAAKAYPFEQYRDPDPEKVKEWKPAGDGKHWYQLG
ncbi:MAG: hypothetical protein LAT65_08595 [Saccharospirillum sp.]|nr:hypothetical protein [Saccharospirillum sp.]